MAEVEVCSCEEALALRRELAEETARAARLEAKLKREHEALTIAENRVAELLPLRAALGKLAKANTRLTKQVRLDRIVIDELRSDLRALRGQEAPA